MQRRYILYFTGSLQEIAARWRLSCRLCVISTGTLAGYEFIDRIHQAKDTVNSTLINPAVLTPTWFAKRDTFRHHSCFPDIAVGALHGAGAGGYSNALQTAVKRLSQSN